MGINKSNRSGIASQVDVLREKILDDENDKEAEIKQSDKNEENKKQYCRELFRVALRYSGVTELDILTKSIEELIACSLADKYCPGLNAASYEVYNKFMINRRAAK